MFVFRKRWSKLSVKFSVCLLTSILVPVGIIFFAITSAYGDLVKTEVRLNTEKNLTYCWRKTEDIFSGMVTISTIINNDVNFMGALKSDSLSYYKKYVIFNRLIQTIYLQNFGLDEDTKIFLIDWQNNVYCNLPFDKSIFGTYELWIPQQNRGQLCWNFENEEADGTRIFTMSRGLYNNNVLSDLIGNLSISIREEQLSSVLEEYVDLKNDCIFLYLGEKDFITGFCKNGMEPSVVFNESINAMNANSSQSFIDEIFGHKYLVNNYTIKSIIDFEGRKLNMIVLSDYQRIFGKVETQMRYLAIILCAMYIVVLCIGLYIPRKIVKPIQKLDHAVRNFKIGDPPINCDGAKNDEVGSLYRGFHHMSESVNTLFKNLKEETIIKENYRYETLRAQINPHFLFNTLSSIKLSAKLIHADNIVENIEALSKMLRYSMSKEENMVAFSREIENVQNYLQIQNTRFGNNIILDLDENIGQFANFRILKFILQPIIENSVLHGFKNYTENGIIFYLRTG